MTVVVRRPRPEELARIGALTVEAYRADGFFDVSSEYEVELRDAAARDRDAELWVAAEENGSAGALVGTVTICPVGSPYREVAVDDSEAEFRMLAVATTARRRGLARLLVLHCIEQARTAGQRRLVLCSHEDMASARRLYASLGFQRLPERDWHPAPGVELLAMGLDLA